MFSDVIKSSLEKETEGQRRAINSIVRGVTRIVSGLMPLERSWCAYLFIGPSGTGKTHLVQTLARTVHGHERRMIAADCTHFAQGDPCATLGAQLAPLFTIPRAQDNMTVFEAPPLSIILLEYLERGHKDIPRALAAALETGTIDLPHGRRGSLRNCIVFLTTGLCSREILDEAPGIGFQATPEDMDADEEQDRIYKLCRDKSVERFGTDLVGRLDTMVVFHRLEEKDLSGILDRRLVRLNQYLALRGFRCELQSAAKEFLLGRGRRDLKLGAQNLVRAHQRYVEFPLADLLVSGRIPAGGVVTADRKPGEEHLHFTVEGDKPADRQKARPGAFREVPVG